MERTGLGSRVVIRQYNRGIESIDSLGVSNSELLQATGAIGCQLTEIVIEGAILLQHEENVLDGSRTSRRHRHSSRLLNRVVSVHTRWCCVGGGHAWGDLRQALRQRTRIADRIAGSVADGE